MTCGKRTVLVLRSFITQRLMASPTVAPTEKVRQRTTAKRIRLPLLHSCPGGIRKASIHSPWRNLNYPATLALFNRGFGKKTGALTGHDASVCIDAVKCIPLLLLIVLSAAANSCTTFVNRRDLYSPEPAPDSLEAMRQMTAVTTTSTSARSEEVTPPPELRRY